MIAHRLSTVVDADTIVVLKDGRLVESGRHLDLLEGRGEYYAMWMRQASSQGAGASVGSGGGRGILGGAESVGALQVRALSAASADVLQIARPDRGPIPPPRSEVTTTLAKSQVEEAGGGGRGRGESGG